MTARAKVNPHRRPQSVLLAKIGVRADCGPCNSTLSSSDPQMSSVTPSPVGSISGLILDALYAVAENSTLNTHPRVWARIN
jgi:hypothetical protein